MQEGEAHILSPTQFEHYWPQIQADMDKVRHTWEVWWTKEAIYTAVMDSTLTVWVVGGREKIHLIIFTQIVHFPANTILKIVLMLGNSLEKYYDIAEATIEKFAYNRGCDYIETCARDGFKRRIKGASYHGVVLVKRVDETKVQ